MKKNRIYKTGMILLSLLLILVAILSYKQSSFASWKEEEEGRKYIKEDGTLAIGFVQIEEQLYYFDSDGFVRTGKFYVEDEAAYYYADAEGVIQTGVVESGDNFYIINDQGKIQTGFVDLDGKRYFFNGNADLVKGWFKPDENWYYADSSGVILTGLITVDGYRYYLNEDGSRVSDCIMDIDGVTYIFNKDGSVDENSTMMYPLYRHLCDMRQQLNIEQELLLEPKVSSCAVIRASKLHAWFTEHDESIESIETALKNRGIKCAGGFEISYGGLENYGVEQLMTDMSQDDSLIKVLENPGVNQVGLGFYQVDGLLYYDFMFLLSE